MSRLGRASGEGTARERGSTGTSQPSFDGEGSLSVSVLERIVEVCNEFEDLWHSGDEPRIEDYLGQSGNPERSERLAALLAVELELRFRSGETAEPADYVDRFPEDAERVRETFEQVRDDSVRPQAQTCSDDSRFRSRSGRSRSQSADGSGTEAPAHFENPPEARRGGVWGEEDELATSAPENGVYDDRARRPRHNVPTLSGNGGADLTFVLGQAEVLDAVGEESKGGAGPAKPAFPATYGPPARRTGRFTLNRLIDSGMFGDVYLANDDMLHRQVALKFPKLGSSVSSARVEAFLIEARNAAQLDHRGIVTIYDVVERQGVGGIFVVMEYVNGSTLHDLLRTERFAAERAASLLADVADAVHYAHGRGFIHRDLKPSNILIDESGRPRVTDFGLAVHEQALEDHAGEVAGTIPYMAPEQARGATHRLDGRTDVWALGVILYEVLTGSRPFPSERKQAFNEILYRNPTPPCDIDPSVPAELERICLKCLSKRMRERYATADELAEDLRRWLSTRAPSTIGSGWAAVGSGSGSGEYSSLRTQVWSRPARAGPEQARVVPKGLRPFSPEDAPFFLDLMPGPRDRNALPECARFWKTRIDSTDRETAFTLGLIHGPSGCGKSSLVQAGILPRLAPHVLTVTISTTREGTEAELLKRIRQRCPGLPGSLGLAESVRALREGTGLPPGKKLLIVLDQFEQWLQTNAEHDDAPLVEVARQCDGARVQALILVRNDFWTALNRFLRMLEAELSTDRNMAAVDLFDRRHARAVLAAFGRGHGSLPEDPGAISGEQNEFLDQAVEGLAEGERVVCVSLALLAEMVKDRPWTPATLEEIGGIRGVGIAFLDNAVGDRAQHPVLRPNRAAAQAILEALLPPAGLNLKERVRSFHELMVAAGCQGRRRDFEAVLRVLDGELRLITPVEPEIEDRDERAPSTTPAVSAAGREPRYQLTHDYLVPSIREWLQRRKRETRHGRAHLRLDVLAALWNDRPQPRFLPSFLEWLSIRRHTLPGEWTDGERAMMRAATARMMWKAVAIAAAVAIVAGLWLRRQDGDPRAEPRIAAVAADHQPWPTELHARVLDRTATPEDRLTAALSLLAHGTSLTPDERMALEGECRRLREAKRPKDDAR